MNRLTIKLKNITHSFDSKEILSVDELTVYENDRIGIIGDNGAGKSTLLNIISGDIVPEKGIVQREICFNHFDQIAEADEMLHVNYLDGELLSRFGVPTNQVETLSGGEETKFRLTQVLSTYQPGLLLDEPTTHLDKKGVESLIGELTYYYGTLVFVSHDRYFLNKLATKIWEVANGTVVEYAGNYEDYKQQKALAVLENKRAVEGYAKEKKRLEQAISQKKQQAEKSRQVSDKKKKQRIKPDRLSASRSKDTVQKNLMKTAKAMESRLEKMTEQRLIETAAPIVFPIQKSAAIHNKFPVRGENVTITKGPRTLFNECDFQFGLNKKIAIVGDNGSGKTTLLQHIVANGDGIVLSPKVIFSFYRQMAYKLSSTRPVLDYLMQQTDYTEPLVRSILNNLGFSQIEITKAVGDLSGGEATRLALALLFVKPANVLVLDEPTNFVDLRTIEALENLIRSYAGTVIFTSHDFYFVERTADDIYAIKNKQLKLISKEQLMELSGSAVDRK